MEGPAADPPGRSASRPELDAQLVEVIDEIAAERAGALTDMTLEEARRSVLAMRRFNGPRRPMATVLELSIPGGDGRSLPARLYRPPAVGRPGTVVFFHGGGWTLGSVDFADGPVRDLAAASGVSWISCSYRLAPEHPFPAAFDDACAATAWVAAHADELGLTGPLAVCGESSGANLAAAVALAARERRVPPLAHQLLFFPPLGVNFETASYRRFAHGYVLEREEMIGFWGRYLGGSVDDAPALAAPLRAPALDGVAPATVVVAGCDPLRDDGLAYGDRLRRAGIAAETVVWDGLTHGAFLMTGRVDRVPVLLREAVTGLARALEA